ncbi:uncharacterized protein BO87DRAFT_457790 [Aspergillus neoniger CBS 115656]|uniref:ABM domain-containing protein n=1 Tax=Aspergillus neoniger (strain CBS 115656) TaxID=1448310 RepID=A0A318YLW8_ASPNB|nr:hypothetical protein BO87DRAFT_457790 [Aspergillus neoniger CBS 115656]PYH35601.1 hypothetical protein BO87DRAFT_457790 [Aspergillus neoniger CBS 115656]
MKVTLTLKRAPSADDIAFLYDSLRAIHPDVKETSREGLSICFAAPTTDVEEFVDLFLSWLYSPDSIMEGYALFDAFPAVLEVAQALTIAVLLFPYQPLFQTLQDVIP